MEDEQNKSTDFEEKIDSDDSGDWSQETSLSRQENLLRDERGQKENAMAQTASHEMLRLQQEGFTEFEAERLILLRRIGAGPIYIEENWRVSRLEQALNAAVRLTDSPLTHVGNFFRRLGNGISSFFTPQATNQVQSTVRENNQNRDRSSNVDGDDNRERNRIVIDEDGQTTVKVEDDKVEGEEIGFDDDGDRPILPIPDEGEQRKERLEDNIPGPSGRRSNVVVEQQGEEENEDDEKEESRTDREDGHNRKAFEAREKEK